MLDAVQLVPQTTDLLDQFCLLSGVPLSCFFLGRVQQLDSAAGVGQLGFEVLGLLENLLQTVVCSWAKAFCCSAKWREQARPGVASVVSEALHLFEFVRIT